MRDAAAEMATALAMEAVLLGVAYRLKHGRRKPGHRYVRRLAGAVVSELVAEGFAVTYAQRWRLRLAIDRAAAAQHRERIRQHLQRIPVQRRPRSPQVV